MTPKQAARELNSLIDKALQTLEVHNNMYLQGWRNPVNINAHKQYEQLLKLYDWVEIIQDTSQPIEIVLPIDET